MRGRRRERAPRDGAAVLPERERLVLSLYYDEELNLREIGAGLEVTETRVCQIYGQAVARLRARLESWFVLTRGEADLVRRLHGSRASRADAR